MITCWNCKAENEPEAVFCGACGKPLTPPKDTDEGVAPGEGSGAPAEGTGTGPAGTGPAGTGTTETGSGEISPDGPGQEKLSGGGAEGGSDDEGSGQTGGDAGGTSVPQEIVCPHCSTPNDPTRVFCINCSKRLRPDTGGGGGGGGGGGDGGGRPSTAVILSAIGAIVAVVVIALLVLGGGDPGKTTSPTGEATSSPDAGTATPPASQEPGAPGRIAYSRCVDEFDCELVMISPDGTGEHVLVPVGWDATFSSQGDRILYSRRGGLWNINLESQLSEQHSGVRGDWSVAWSADDSHIAFARRYDRPDPDSPHGLRYDVPNSDLDSLELITDDTDNHDPVFTPDGRVIWVRGEGDQREFWITDPEVPDPADVAIQLTDNEFNDVDPALSPDGTLLVFASRHDRDGEFDLYIVEVGALDGPLPEPTLLVDLPGQEHDPSWSPDGRWIVFTGTGMNDVHDLFIVDTKGTVDPADDADPVQLTSTPEMEKWADWSDCLGAAEVCG